MAPQPFTATLETLHQIVELVRDSHKTADALVAALAWLVLGRLAREGRMSPVGSTLLEDQPGPVELARAANCPPSLRDAMVEALTGWPAHQTNEAAHLVRQLLDRHSTAYRHLRDVVWIIGNRTRNPAFSHRSSLDPAACDLAVKSLHLAPGDHVWVPFDASGQITARIAAHGVRVWRAGPGFDSRVITALLLALEEDLDVLKQVAFIAGHPSDTDGTPITKCLVAAPQGMKISESDPWRAWQRMARSEQAIWITPDELDRSDAWAVATMWPHVKERGVFLTSPSLLFAHGQEQRLRKALLMDARGNMVEAVGSLPPGTMSQSSTATALLVLDRTQSCHSVRLADLRDSEVADGAGQIGEHNASVDLNHLLLEPDQQTGSSSIDVDILELESCDYSLVPLRYLKRVDDLTGVRRTLGDLIDVVVRSPVPAKDPGAWPVWEIGISRLDHWRPIASGYERYMHITSKKASEALLREGDLVLSIKGTLGKVGIVGAIPASVTQANDAVSEKRPADNHSLLPGHPKTPAAVVAASCVGLRVDRQEVLPEYLLLYLRSQDFKRQIESLRVGTAIAHITPAALLSSVKVLWMPMEEQRKLCESYQSLCENEQAIEQLKSQMEQTQFMLFAESNNH